MNTYKKLCIHSLIKSQCKRCKYKCGGSAFLDYSV